jgi:hypothetical protein
MARAFVALLVLLAVSLAGSSWWLLQPPLTPLLIPGVTNIHIGSTRWGEHELTYHAPGEPYAWYDAVTTHLRNSGWTPPDRFGGIPLRHVIPSIV